MNQQQYPPTEYQKNTEFNWLNPGTIIANRFEIQKVIGGGGFSIVYKATDRLMNSCVAVKEYFPVQYAERSVNGVRVEVREGNNQVQFAKGLEQFCREAKQTAALGEKHNVVNVITYAEDNGTAYMIMEYLEGMTLKEYQKTLPGGVFTNISEAITIIAAIAEALSYCHQKKLLHRDVSADNIFLCSRGAMKLIDFGNAHKEIEGEFSSIVVKDGCTPPEQYSRTGKQGTWTDLYALSAVFYRMLTGEYPDTAPDRQAEGVPELKSVREINPEVPEYIDALIMRCLDLNYRIRLSSADEYLKILRSRRVVDSGPKVLHKRRFWEAAAAVCSVVFVILLVSVCGVLWKKSQILDPCTLYVAVPEHFSTEEGLAEAERLFEEKWNTVDLVFMPENSPSYVPAVYPAEEGENSVTAAVDAAIFYINLLKAGNAEISYPVQEDLITDSYAEFLSEDSPCRIYRGHIYEYRTIESDPRLMAQFEAWEVPDESARSVSFRYSENLNPSEEKAAKTFLKFLTSEDAQKALFLEECGMRPANPALLDDYYAVYNNVKTFEEKKG